ncbi:rRNA processing protein [Penicillium argentinense]|uniref:rRNA processing protein n=1 Tax=Penicillium argentinense TaxID=1131581 RepID=A0A9W9KFI5_9EURO|nr:rRNA processing protein [Penicillium argentinense]KAJ5103906.1 rRNA processing protein [Penicillium argentinense]
MRAKRSKKYRKLMHQYEMTFGFREPYQVLVDSNFLHAIDSFKMELIPSLERTLQGKPKPLLPGCHHGCATNQPQDQPALPSPPSPPPTELPLRHCSHNTESEPIDEIDCLLSLLSPNADTKKNKEHYILATADAPVKKQDKNDTQQRKRKRDEEREEERAVRRAQMLRFRARSIPGVPIIYVKRSVMVLEPMSSPSENVRDNAEKAKFRFGLGDAASDKPTEEPKKKKGPKVKGPNPLSVMKSKKKVVAGPAITPKKGKSLKNTEETSKNDDAAEQPGGEEAGASKPKRRRRHHHKNAAPHGNDDAAPSTETGPNTGSMEVDE